MQLRDMPEMQKPDTDGSTENREMTIHGTLSGQLMGAQMKNFMAVLGIALACVLGFQSDVLMPGYTPGKRFIILALPLLVGTLVGAGFWRE